MKFPDISHIGLYILPIIVFLPKRAACLQYYEQIRLLRESPLKNRQNLVEKAQSTSVSLRISLTPVFDDEENSKEILSMSLTEATM